MKTFRCNFFNNDDRKAIDVIAGDARTAASRVVAQSQGLPFQRVEVEDEKGLAYMWFARAAAMPESRKRAA